MKQMYKPREFSSNRTYLPRVKRRERSPVNVGLSGDENIEANRTWEENYKLQFLV
jgi:hypothetical protein